ncbi:hypothetical protein ACAN107058_05075 [Paracidovorax anthurii]|uniref:Uncharacterized protein n=2 Tax=Paracidovorax anthurii TaxID=78229 RepID=A0A328ZEL4_9BURK|nr:hypothetical protein [Paracidovorax anthurii]RAR80666.1 hypothetical protein AX018_102224 [Paracidovorax anthurii]
MGVRLLPEIAAPAARGTPGPVVGRESPFTDAAATIAAVEGGLRTPGRAVLTFQGLPRPGQYIRMEITLNTPIEPGFQIISG